MTIYSLTFIFEVDDDGEERTIVAKTESLIMAGAGCSAALQQLTGLRLVAMDPQSLPKLPDWIPTRPNPALN